MDWMNGSSKLYPMQLPICLRREISGTREYPRWFMPTTHRLKCMYTYIQVSMYYLFYGVFCCVSYLCSMYQTFPIDRTLPSHCSLRHALVYYLYYIQVQAQSLFITSTRMHSRLLLVLPLSTRRSHPLSARHGHPLSARHSHPLSARCSQSSRCSRHSQMQPLHQKQKKRKLKLPQTSTKRSKHSAARNRLFQRKQARVKKDANSVVIDVDNYVVKNVKEWLPDLKERWYCIRYGGWRTISSMLLKWHLPLCFWPARWPAGKDAVIMPRCACGSDVYSSLCVCLSYRDSDSTRVIHVLIHVQIQCSLGFKFARFLR